MIHVIATDLDHTLLRENHALSKETAKVLSHLHDQGLKVILASGRPVPGLTDLNAQLGLMQPEDYSIYFNGALVLNNRTGYEIYSRTLTAETLEAVGQFAQQEAIPVEYISADTVYSTTDFGRSSYSTFAPKGMKFSYVKQAEFFPRKPIYKIGFANEPLRIDALQATIKMLNVSVTRSRREFLELMPLGVNKAVGLEKVVHQLGYNAQQVMAFGDEENDLEMLRYAGVSIAVANAQTKVKAVARYITDTNEVDGVAQFLKSWFSTSS